MIFRVKRKTRERRKRLTNKNGLKFFKIELIQSAMNGAVNFEDVEFLAEDEMLKVTPKFREGRLQMITGNFGPFTPGVPLQVPAWMAINLG